MATEPSRRPETPGLLSDLLQTRYREVTVSAVLLAIIIGVIMNAAITYAGLKIGFTIGGSAIAAVLGFGVMRGLYRPLYRSIRKTDEGLPGSILETNITQTVASAVNTSNSGVIFTVPVLFLIGYELTVGDTDFWLITLACVAGAFLGTAFIIPLRKQMLDIERLRFPSPTGVATILKSPGAGPAKSVVLLAGILLGALIYLPSGLPALTSEADLEDLDSLFEAGKISHAQREQTRAMASWIEQGSAPAALLDRGEQIERVLGQIEAAQTRKDELAPTDVDGRATMDATIEAFRTELTALAEGQDYSNDLAHAAYLASSDSAMGWESLRDKNLGWAADPMFGYSDIGWRLDAEVDPEGTAADRNGDGTPDDQLTKRVDRDQDGRPDLLLTDSTIDVGRLIGLPDQYQLLFAIAPFALGAGYITGRAGLFVLAGGILAFFVLNPVAYSMGWMPATTEAHQAPGYGFGAFNRPLGIGLLLGGALMGVLFSLPAIREALKSIAGGARQAGGSDELGFKTLAVTVVIGFVFLFLAADFVGNKALNLNCPITGEAISSEVDTAQYKGYAIGFSSADAATAWEADRDDTERDAFLETLNASRPGWLSMLNPHLRAILIAIVGAAWIWFAGIIIAQCAGMTDWSPISGMALLTVVLVMLLAGTGAVVGAVLIGAALCVAITLAADMMGDLKTGYLVGAKPKRQQTVELLVVGIGPIVCMLTLMLIVEGNRAQVGLPLGPGTPTVAPQAQALQAVITGVQGGEMPYALYGFGAALGALLGLGVFPGLGVLVGLSMYLPFMYIATYGVGCLINMAVAKIKGKAWAESWGVPFCAGLIVGESILALIINIYIVLGSG